MPTTPQPLIDAIRDLADATYSLPRKQQSAALVVRDACDRVLAEVERWAVHDQRLRDDAEREIAALRQRLAEAERGRVAG